MWMINSQDTFPNSYTIFHKSYSFNFFTVSLPRERQVVHARQRVWVVHSELHLARLHDLHLQLFSIIPPALVRKRRCQVGHARQRVWMVHSELRLARLHDLHLQLFSIIPPAL